MPHVTPRLATREVMTYGALGFPLAMAALPIYVAVPRFYTDTLGLDLSLVGFILLLARALDAVQDPLLGYASDRSQARGHGRLCWVALGMPLLGAGMLGLLTPPTSSPGLLAAWLCLMLVVVYLGYSMVTVSYQALGAELATDGFERTRITAWREGLALLGVFLAAALPEYWATTLGPRAAYARFALVFVALLVLFGGVTLKFGPRPPPRLAPRVSWRAMFGPLENPAFRRLALVFVLNGIAASIPATVVLFFIADVIGRENLSALFLVAYFAAGALGMPVWLAASRRLGKRGAWFLGMLLSIAAFVWVYTLGAGDVTAYLVICVLSGLSLGADLALPPALLADVIDDDERRGLPRAEGAYFGLWNLLGKANLALAAGLGLPLLAALGYQPSATEPSALNALSTVYALVPCMLKALAALALASFGLRAPAVPSPPSSAEESKP